MSITINSAKIYTTATSPSGYPNMGIPEIAFVGRSNVGKSTLINKLAGRKALARTSGAPGKTRAINFFLIEEKLFFVDLPGYGYAKVSKTERESWGAMIENYLKKRDELKAVMLLTDIRREPSENDKMMFEWLQYYNKKTIIAATKSDKIKRSQLKKHTDIIKKTLGATQHIIPFSKEDSTGAEALWNEIMLVLDIVSLVK